ncbi:hypothetical protein QJS10_CPB04g00991 [Acorus calamus]|uniref:INO80 complex subunit B-like conserved region domain-containing protein n=1 Tax=Acorus calamus TaxID=4465 RepID=A0AAV9F2H8_ACOCL|nr:hypothetical protein QJS10_CPB04g00991 [Acorus calamus]
MEGLGGSGFGIANAVTKKRRSVSSRRPRLDSQAILSGSNVSPNSSTPSSDNMSKPSSDENPGYEASIGKKEFNLNNAASRSISVNKTMRKDERGFGHIDRLYGNTSTSRGGTSMINDQGHNGSDLKRCSEGVLAPANWKGSTKMKEISDIHPMNVEGYVGHKRTVDVHNMGQSGGMATDENKPRKVKLKLGGVTRTIHAKSNADVAVGGIGSLLLAKPPRSMEPTQQRRKILLQETSDDDQSPPEKGSSFQGSSQKGFTKGDLAASKQADKSTILSSEPTRKSKRVPKRRVLDIAFDDGDEDDEMRYLERLKISKAGRADPLPEYEADGMEDIKKQKLLNSKKQVGNNDYDNYGLTSRHTKDSRKKSRSTRGFDDMDYFEEEEELGSDTAPDAKKKKQKKEPIDTVPVVKSETSLTTRQRALQSGKDGPPTSLIEFPNGLPPAPPRKQKEKLSEVEQQLKKAEAAQRRKIQVEKAARESEAEAIRKILGQDSSRKKREDKMRKRRDELAQEKSENGMMLASDTVRWVSGPSGTVVTFATDVGLPNIFDSKPCSYPPPREKCAGPSCTNTYRYRDSKSKLPLCSLQCYKAIHEESQTENLLMSSHA